MFILVIIFYAIIGVTEIYLLAKKKMKKEIYVYSILLCFSFTISMLLSFGVKVPSPANLIEKVVFAIVGEK